MDQEKPSAVEVQEVRKELESIKTDLGQASEMLLNGLKTSSDTFTKGIVKLIYKYMLISSILSGVAALALGLGIGATIFNSGTDKYVNKQPLKQNILKAISNNCDLQVLKTLYNNRKLQPWGFTEIPSKSEDRYSAYVPLSQILLDVKSDLYLELIHK